MQPLVALRPRSSLLRPRLSVAIGLIVALSWVATLATARLAEASVCSSSAVTVSPMHSPDGTQRPFYADFKSGSTKHSGYVGYEVSGASLGSDVWVRLSGFTGGSIGLGTNQSASVPVRSTSAGGKGLVYVYLKAAAVASTAQTWSVEVWNGRPGQAGSTHVCSAGDGFSKVLDVISANPNSISSITVSSSTPALGSELTVTAIGNTGSMGAGDSGDQVAGKGVLSMSPAMDDAWPADAFLLTGVSIEMRSGSTVTLTERDRLRVYPSSSSAQDYTAVYKFSLRNTTTTDTTIRPVQNIASGTQVKYTGSYPTSIPPVSSPSLTMGLEKTVASVTGPPYVVQYRVDVTNSSTSPITLDYLRDTPTPTGNWTLRAGTATLNGAAISDPVLDSGSLLFRGPFTVPARVGTTNGSLVFRYSLDATGPITNSIVGRLGDLSLSGGGGTNAVTLDPSQPVVSTASFPNGTVGAGYGATLAAAGGTSPYTWAITAGSLPPGLTLNTSTGAISGTPTTAGTSTFTVRVTDGASQTATKSLSITVDPSGAP